MDALVRVQARVRARRVRMSMEVQAVQHMLNERRSKAELLKEAVRHNTRSEIKDTNEARGSLQERKSPHIFSSSHAQKWKSIKNSHSQMKIGKNHITTRISAKPSLIGQTPHTTHSSSSLSSGFHLDKSSASPSFCSLTTPLSRNTSMASSRTDDSNSVSKPNYMNLTEAAKAKQRNMYHRTQSRPEDESKFLRNTNSIWGIKFQLLQKVLTEIEEIKATTYNISHVYEEYNVNRVLDYTNPVINNSDDGPIGNINEKQKEFIPSKHLRRQTRKISAIVTPPLSLLPADAASSVNSNLGHLYLPNFAIHSIAGKDGIIEWWFYRWDLFCMRYRLIFVNNLLKKPVTGGIHYHA
ncbi:hypothetical protein POM88_046624 [Heracleum sosnowskyi]|uniref:Uncharacterized protein n=1 Tax=Heracleum sosnowskyi TaxID=360622 RepID=A0AAD8H7A4_9APIA|nr:hypothetical protein POM88_046624 [Heracleum sosnowskyi]